MAKKKMFIQKAFCFRNFHSTNHAFVSITEEKRQALDEEEFAIQGVEKVILLSKHYLTQQTTV